MKCPVAKSLIVLAFVLIACTQGAFAQTPDSTINVKIDSIQQHTIPSTHKIDSLKDNINSQKQKLNHKIDSLRSLNLSTDKYTRKLDSLNNIDPQKYLSKINQPISNVENKISAVENKINKPISNVGSKINDKLDVMRQEGGAGANIPGNLNNNLSLDKPGIPNADLNLKNNGLDLNNPLDKPSIDKPSLDNPLDKIDKPNIDNPLDKVKSVDELKTAQDKLGDLNQVTDKAQSYSSEVKDLAKGKLDNTKNIGQTIENKAANLSEVKDLQKQTGELDKAKGMIGKGNDPEALKAQAKDAVTKQAVDHFKGQEQALKAAMDKLSKAKEKYSDVSSLKDLPKRPPNAMKGKPLIERILPGITLQIMNSRHFMIDFNPVVSYRFTSHINAGVGWNERISFARWNKLAASDRVYGPRLFGSYGIKKGFSAKIEIEKMNALIPASPLSPDGTRKWVWSAFVGIKKDYKFIGSVRGNAQVLYNLYDDHDNSPYFDRLVVRMGFEFPMKKPKKPQNQPKK